MSFRRNKNKIEYVHWQGEKVSPKAGHYTVYYWIKGAPNDPKNPKPGELWVKADIYGLDGEVFLEGILADNLDQLKLKVPEEIQFYSTP